MSGHVDRRAPAATFLTHFFGGGLIDKGECYVVERFRAMSNGEIRRWPSEAPAKSNGRARAKPEAASFDTVQELRPAYNEIIVCTGLAPCLACNIGYAACSMFGDRIRRR